MNGIVFRLPAKRDKKRKRTIHPTARIVRFSLSGLYFVRTQPFSDCPARAASACSRRSGRYCVSLVSLETTLTGCTKAPPARREGSSGLSAMNGIVFRLPAKRDKKRKRTIHPTARIVRFSLSGLYSQIEPFSDCPARAASACSRRSKRYCVSLMSSKNSLVWPKPPCSRRSGRYYVSLVALETTLTRSPEPSHIQ